MPNNDENPGPRGEARPDEARRPAADSPKRRRARELTQLSPGPQPSARRDSTPDERLNQARKRHAQARAALERGDLDGGLAALAALGEDAELAAAEVALLLDVGDALVQARRSDAARALYGLALACAPQERRAQVALAALPAPAPQRRDFRAGDSLQSNTGNSVYDVEAVFPGGMGVVCKVRQRGSEEVLALKTFRADRLWDEAHRRRFEQEALAWTELGEHPHIVRARRVERIEELPCLLLEWVPAGSLREKLTPVREADTGEILRVLSAEEAPGAAPASQALPLDQTLAYALQCCQALAYAHARFGLMHRDLKPENCLIDAEGHLKVTDFGLARAFGEAQAEAIAAQGLAPGLAGTLSREVGTYPYMAPEQYSGATLSPATDVFGFGVMLWEMLSGERPRLGFLAGELIDASEQRAHLPAALVRLVRDCVADEPGDRPADFVEVWRRIHEEVLGQCPAPLLEIPPRPSEGTRSAAEWHDRGLTLVHLGHPAEALEVFERVIETDGQLVPAWNGKGNALRALGRKEEALAAYARALEIDPRHAAAWTNKGVVLSELRRKEEALVAHEHALEIDPRYALAWANKGNVLWGLGRQEEALAAWERALEIDPRFAGARSNKGAALYALDRKEEALVAWERALEIVPRNATAWSNKSYLLSSMGRHAEALADIERSLEVAPRAGLAWTNRGVVLEALGRDEEAIESFERALEVEPDTRDRRITAGIRAASKLAHKRGDLPRAIALYSRATELLPDEAAPWRGLAACRRALAAGLADAGEAAQLEALAEADEARADAIEPAGEQDQLNLVEEQICAGRQALALREARRCWGRVKEPHNRLICAWLGAIAALLAGQAEETWADYRALIDAEVPRLAPDAWRVTEINTFLAQLRADATFDRAKLARIEDLHERFLAHFGEAGPAST